MIKSILNHPLKDLCKGSIDIYSKNVHKTYSIGLSYLNPFNSFIDYSDDKYNEDEALDKTINILKYLKNRKADVLIESDTGGFSQNIDDFILKFEKRDENAKRLMISIYINFLATNNNKIMIEEMINSILEKNDDVDCSILIKEKEKKLIFDAINIPNHHLVTENFIKYGIKNVTSFLKEKESDINFELKDHNIKICFSIVEYDDLKVDVATGIFSAEGESYLEFKNETKLKLENAFDKYLKGAIVIRGSKFNLSIIGQKTYITSNSFSVGVNGNKNLFGGILNN
jgi:hypothetical protein